jgi:hypothetical protein
MFADHVFQRRLSLTDPVVRTTNAPKPANGGYGWIGIFGMVFLAVALIEAVLGFRVWTQLSGDPIDSEASRFVYRVSGWLTSPFGRYETFQSGRSVGVLQFATLVAAEVYLVAGVIALITVYLLRSWMTPLWELACRPPGFVIRGLKISSAWVANSAGFRLLGLVDQITIVWLEAIQPWAKRALVRAAVYSKREGSIVSREFTTRSERLLEQAAAYARRQGPLVLRSFATRAEQAVEYGKRQGPIVLQAFATRSERLLEQTAKYTRRQGPIVLRASATRAEQAVEYGKRQGPIVLQGFALRLQSVLQALIAIIEKEIRQLNLELQRLAREYASARARNYRG